MEYSILKIDLRVLHSVKDVKRIILHYNLLKDFLDCDLIFAHKKNYSCLFLDAITNRVIASIEKGKTEIEFNPQFKAHLYLMPSFSPSEAKADERKERRKNPPIKTDCKLDIDSILDKISKYGVNSLTVNEKMFLERYSKKL